MKLLKYTLVIVLIVSVLAGYTYWVNYNRETTYSFSKTALYIDEVGNSRETDIEFDVVVLHDKFDNSYELNGDILIGDKKFSFGNEFGYRIYKVEEIYFIGSSPQVEISLTWNFTNEHGIIEFYSDSNGGRGLSGEVVYFPYDGEGIDEILEKVSDLKEMKNKIIYK